MARPPKMVFAILIYCSYNRCKHYLGNSPCRPDTPSDTFTPLTKPSLPITMLSVHLPQTVTVTTGADPGQISPGVIQGPELAPLLVRAAATTKMLRVDCGYLLLRVLLLLSLRSTFRSPGVRINPMSLRTGTPSDFRASPRSDL